VAFEAFDDIVYSDWDDGICGPAAKEKNMPAREPSSVGGIEARRRTGRERGGCRIDRAARACAGGIRVARYPDRGVCRCRGGCGRWLGSRRFGRNEAKPEGEEDCNLNSWYLVVYMWKAW